MATRQQVARLTHRLGATMHVLAERPLEVQIEAPSGKVFAASGTTLLVVTQDGGSRGDRADVWRTLARDLEDGVRREEGS